MNADEYILQLPYINLKSREHLPEKSGIYYVVDEKFIIWYVGQAKNLRNRWVGKSHHRLYQLSKQRQKQFYIYYELVAESLLDAIEQQRIEQYNPQLNRTKVKAQKLHPTETLLRETLMILAPYSFVLGVEIPRKDDIQLVKDSIHWRQEWRVQKTVLPLHVIHICINLQELTTTVNNWRIAINFLKNIFKKRSNYSDNWACKGNIKDEKFGRFLLRRLLVNGFAIEVYGIRQEVGEYIKGYELTKLAGVDIRTVNQESLAALKNQCLLNVSGISLPYENENNSYQELCQRAIKRLSPYTEDLVKVIFNEDIAKSRLTLLPRETKKQEENNIGFSVRLANLATKKEYLKALLTERGFDLNCYEVNKYLDKIPKDNNYVDSNHDRKMTVYIKSFTYQDLRLPGHYSSTIYGSQGVVYQSHNILHCQYEEVYLAAQVDRAFWLLLEVYLSDFSKVKLNDKEGYLNKQYISARKTLKPSILTITLNGKWKADIPFGPKDNMSYYDVKEIIENRLQTSGIPKLNFSFRFM